MIKVFSILDAKAQVFSNPWYAPTVAYAIRSFEALANDPGTLIGKHPEDFSLYQLGDFDDGFGKFADEEPRQIATALSLVKANINA